MSFSAEISPCASETIPPNRNKVASAPHTRVCADRARGALSALRVAHSAIVSCVTLASANHKRQRAHVCLTPIALLRMPAWLVYKQ
eukprot:m.275454 g.275454  ORF g.275454 m.275454 type:complete len:86 (-) comp15696_c2_seq1:28-285(-)